MRVRSSVKPRCAKCRVQRRKGRVLRAVQQPQA